MASLSKNEIKLIESLINLKEEVTKQCMSEYINGNYDHVVETPDYIYATGNAMNIYYLEVNP